MYLRAKYYDPNIGRFISEDTAKDGYNWYVYCGNDPVNRGDPSVLSFFSDAVDYWYDGISVLQHSGKAGQIFASYSLGVMDTISGQINGIRSFVSNPIGSIVNGWNAFRQNPLVNNPISQMGIGVYNFYSGLAKASYNEDWNSVAYSLGGATVVAGEMAAAYEISSVVKNALTLDRMSVNNSATSSSLSNSTPISNDIINLPRVGSALKSDPFHSFPDIVDNYAGMATKTSLRNAMLYQLEGSLNGHLGRFEWIVQDHQVTHRLFVKGGGINGIPIRP